MRYPARARADGESSRLRLPVTWHGKFVEIGVTGVGIVIDAVNLPPLLSVGCSLLLAVTVAVLRWVLRMLGRGRPGD